MMNRERNHFAVRIARMEANGVDVSAKLAADDRILYTVMDVSRILNVGRATIYKLMDAGDLASLHIGTSRRIERTEVQRFVEEARAH